MRLLMFIGLFWCLQSHANTYQVTLNHDPEPDGCGAIECSLREAILEANANPGFDTITISLIEIGLTHLGQDDEALLGDLDITDDLKIIGVFQNTFPLQVTTINAQFLDDRIFDVANGVSLDLENLQLLGARNNDHHGGAIRVTDSSLRLFRVFVGANAAEIGGGVYAKNSSLTVEASTFDTNFAELVGGAMALFNSTLWVNESIIIQNAAQFGAGLYIKGFESFTEAPPVLIQHSELLGNVADREGAGLYLWAGLPSNSNAKQTARLDNLLINVNYAYANGGGIYHHSGKLHITSSTFRFNQVSSSIDGQNALGSAIYSGGGTDTGHASHLTLGYSLIYENAAISTPSGTGRGAGLYLDGDATIINNTFSKNTAASAAALDIKSGQVDLIHNTFSGNDSGVTADLYFEIGSHSFIQNNIINDRCLIVAFAEVNSGGGNIETPGNTCQMTIYDLKGQVRSDLIDLNLADNGGATLTHALSSNSDAIGFAVLIPAITDDQRMLDRDNQPDSGAYEVQSRTRNTIFRDSFED